MGYKEIKNGRWRVVARLRQGGKIVHRAKTFDGSKEDAKACFEELKRSIREGRKPESSLTLSPISTFSDIAKYFTERKGYIGMKNYFVTLIADLGSVPLNQIGVRFDGYLQYLKTSVSPKTDRKRKPNTINHYISVAKMICSFALKNEILSKNPMGRFDKFPEESRDRILTDKEQKRLLNTLKETGSYLYWAVLFSLKNPIRFNDLFNLKRENFDMINNWVHFYASKTAERRNQETCLVCIDEEMRKYFSSLPHDCPYLFPKIKNGRWSKITSTGYRNHWKTILRLSKIKDFTWHDQKHCALTFMRDNDFTELDFENLGIAFTKRMIRLYYKTDAIKAISKWNKIQENRKREADVKLSLCERS